MPAPDREHGHEPRGRRVRRADPELAALARDRLGRRRHLPARPARALRAGGASARRRGQGVRGRGRDPLPDARRGHDGLGRRGQGPDRVPERAARGPRTRPLGRPPDLQLRLAGGGLARRDHARDPRRRPRLEHAQADPDPAGARLRDPDVRARAERLRRGRQEALEASRRRLGGRVPRGGVHRAGADELPRAARLGAGRRDDDHVAGRADRALLARAGRRQPGDVRLREARLDERRLPPRALAGGLRRHADRLPARAGVRLAGGADPCGGADRAGEDREAGGVPRVRRLPLPRGRARSGPARPRRADGGRGGARRGRAVGGVAARGDVSSR